MAANGRSRRDRILEELRAMKNRPNEFGDWSGDPAEDHKRADELLLKLVDIEIAVAFNEIKKWYE